MTKEILNQLFELHQMSDNETQYQGKSVTAYCDPWTFRAGDDVEWRASSHKKTAGVLEVVRLECGDPTRSGPGFSECIVSDLEAIPITLDEQAVIPGSYAHAALRGVSEEMFRIGFWFQPTLLTRDGPICWVESATDNIEIRVQKSLLVLELGGVRVQLRDILLERHRWYRLDLTLQLDKGIGTATVESPETRSPGRDLVQAGETTTQFQIPALLLENPSVYFGAGTNESRWDGRIAEPFVSLGVSEYSWSLEDDMAGNSVPSGKDHGDLQLFQLPTRAVPGPGWTGSHQRWTDAPNEWNAVHFHHDDLYDAGWHVSAAISLPKDLESGIYCLRFTTSEEVDRVPFFVRPVKGGVHSDVALLMPTCTYMAYANHRMLINGADFMNARSKLRPEHQYLVDHPELGLSHYEKHPDGSGVMFSSRRRPVLQVRPGADGWNFTPDTDIDAFLTHTDVGHDVVTDEDLHFEGVDAISNYRVLVTGSHPEYWSTEMLDALEEWQRNGGRLMYLGGNGFYWRVAFSDAWPGAIELRRAEDGVRNWQTRDGENYHAWGSEYGGLWRRNGRSPNQLVGIGFSAQGFEKASFYVRDPEVLESRASWILDGVENDEIGTSGLGGGAAGQEIDRYDVRLGSPEHAVIVASATEFAPDMLRTKEEFEGTVAFPDPDPFVRSDIVFYETPNGGAVFSVGSISWFGALARDGYDNDVAQITRNVLTRFVDPAPLEYETP